MATTKKPAARKTAAKKPAARKAAPKKPVAKKNTATKTSKQVTNARTVQAADAKTRKPVAEHTARKTVSSKNRVATAVKKTTVLGLEVPTIDLRKFDLPSTDELRTEVVERLETAQDAVVAAPARVQELAGDLHTIYLDRVSDAIDKVREITNR